MNSKPTASILHHFSTIKDPRVNRQKKHKLQDIFFITLCAAICMVSAWAQHNSLVLGQVKVDDKSNEITAIPKSYRD